VAQHKARKIAKLILPPVVITFLCFLFLEVLMIVLEPYLFTGFYQYDPDLGFRVRPYTRQTSRFGLGRPYAHRTNQFGFNDRDYPLEKDPNTFRILVISDSFNWAGGLEGNYTAKLEKKFEEYYGEHRVDVINAGYPGTHTGQQLALLKKYGLQYSPDLVFLGFFVGNDFLAANPQVKRIIVNDTFYTIDRRKDRTLLGYPIIPRSRLIHFVKQKYKTFKELRRARRETTASGESPEGGNGGTFSEDTFLEIEKIRLEFCNVEKHRAHVFDDRIRYIFQSISEMRDLLHSRDIGFVVGIYPDEFQVNSDLLNQVFERFSLEREDYDNELTQRILKEYLDLEHIPSVDFLDEFRRKGREIPLYLLRDTHWNEAGNELAAEIIFRYVLDIVERQKNGKIDSSMEESTFGSTVHAGSTSSLGSRDEAMS